MKTSVLLMSLLLGALLARPARAGPTTTADSLDRLEESLVLRVEDGRLSPDDVLPALLVSADPRTEEASAWYVTRVIELLERAFGPDGLRLCEACMAPRLLVEQGRMSLQTGPVAVEEIVRLDDGARGTSEPAKSAIWVDAGPHGVSIRVLDLATSRVIHAQNVDPDLDEFRRTRRSFTRAEELERRARGDAVTQAFVDFAVYPGQHIALDWTDQWGTSNANLSGITLSVIDPVLGLGVSHYRAIPLLDTLVGGKLLISLPSVILDSLGDSGGFLLENKLTVVGVARVPFGRSNYGAIVTLSTNGNFGLGISLMNVSLLPFLP